MQYFAYLTQNYTATIFGFSKILTDVLFPLSVVFLFHKFRKSGKNILVFFLRWIVLFVLQINFNCLRVFLSLSSGYWNLLVIPGILLVLTALLVRDYHAYVRIAWATVMLLFFYFGHCYYSLFDYLGQGQNAVLESTCAQAAVFCAGAVYLKCNSFENCLSGVSYFLIGLEIITAVSLAVEIVMVEYYGDVGIPFVNVYLVTGLLIAEVAVYHLFVKFMRRNAVYTQETVALKEISAQYEMAQLSAKNYAELKMLRHDMKNQYATIAILLKEKEYDKAESFFRELCDWAELPFSEISTGNSVVDTVLNFKSLAAREKGIAFSAGVAVPGKLPVKDTDLAGILTNLLDNAIENSPGEGGEIRAELYLSGNVLSFSVTNRMEEGADPGKALRLQTTKADRDSHGWGTRIVRKTAEKYGGTIRYSVRDGNVFAAEGMLLLDFAEEKEGE